MTRLSVLTTFLFVFGILIDAIAAGESPEPSSTEEVAFASKKDGITMTLCTARGGLFNPGVVREFQKAWSYTAAGTKKIESVVLVFLQPDGTYRAVSQGYTNERYQFTFRWHPSAVAIVHTHPNDRDPEPHLEDERVADRFGVPIFTITNRGMYLYDPRTRKTSKVRDQLEWLKPCLTGPYIYSDF